MCGNVKMWIFLFIWLFHSRPIKFLLLHCKWLYLSILLKNIANGFDLTMCFVFVSLSALYSQSCTNWCDNLWAYSSPPLEGLGAVSLLFPPYHHATIFLRFPISHFSSLRMFAALGVSLYIVVKSCCPLIFFMACVSVFVFVLYWSHGYYGYFCSNTECHGLSVHLLRLIRVIRTVPSSTSVFSVCLRVRFLFCTDLTDTTDIFVRTRSFTKCHGIFVHLPPFNPCYLYSSPIRLRVFPCVSVFVFCSVLISRILRIFLFEHGVSRTLCPSASV